MVDIEGITLGSGALSNEFFNQVNTLRKSCNNFDEVQMKLSELNKSGNMEDK